MAVSSGSFSDEKPSASNLSSFYHIKSREKLDKVKMKEMVRTKKGEELLNLIQAAVELNEDDDVYKIFAKDEKATSKVTTTYEL